jgi:serine-type D-Ala-D-Ala carboxypeptidase (penicillin-binding protein 5/6)
MRRAPSSLLYDGQKAYGFIDLSTKESRAGQKSPVSECLSNKRENKKQFFKGKEMLYKRLLLFVFGVFVLWFCALTPAGAGSTPDSGISPGQINATSALLLEVSSGITIFEQNADEPIEPASFTKILTLYLINEELKKGSVHLDDEVYISEQAWRTGGSKMFLKVGTSVPLREIIKGIAVVSGNDACVAAGEHFAGSLGAFVERMNKKSRELGMSGSRFSNPHGLPAEGQITTARDIGKMNLAYLRLFPESLQFHSMQDYSFSGITQPNRNRLLWSDSSVDGLKTGYVTASGYHLAATAEREGMRLLAVVMGASSAAAREREAMKLLNFGFRFYSLVKPFAKGERISNIRVWKGKKNELNLYPSESPDFVVAQANRNFLRWEVRTAADVTAPVAAGTRLGEVVFYVSDKPQRTVPLVNREELARAGWFKSSWQTLLRILVVNWKMSAIGAGVILVLFTVVLVVVRRKGARRSRLPLIR